MAKIPSSCRIILAHERQGGRATVESLSKACVQRRSVAGIPDCLIAPRVKVSHGRLVKLKSIDVNYK